MKPLSPSPYVEPLDAATLDRLKALYKQLIDAENRRLNKLLQNLGGGIFYWEAPPTCPTVIETASANTPIVGATDTFPIQITTATAHDYSTGQVVLIKDVLGNTAANGTWIITVTSGTSFNLNGSAGNGPYIHGGGTAFTTKITTAPHGLVSLQLAMIAGVNGTTSANGTWRCTVLSSTTFSIASEWNAAWTSGGTVGDGGTAIPSSASNGRWRRIYSGALNVRWFGAIGIVNLVTGVIFDGTEVSTIRDCYFECMNGVWVTGGNQRLNNPLTDPNNEYGQSNVIFVDNSWFGCSQISYAAEGNATQRLNGCNFENGLWYGWTSGVELLRVADMQSEAGASGWYIGTLAPFNGNQSGANYGVLFDNCLISPAAQSSTNVATVTNSSGLFEIATAAPHGLYTGAWAWIKGTAGAAGLNGTWTITAVDPTHLILQGSTYSSGYTGGGTVLAVSPCVQANNIMSAPSSVISTPFQNLRLERCRTTTSAPHADYGRVLGKRNDHH